MRRTTAAALPLTLVLLAAAAVSQMPPEEAPPESVPQGDAAEPSSLFFDRTEVNVVNVEVYVTDKKGDPVAGLTRGDFEIFENGQPMEVTNFYAVAGGRPAAGSTPAALPERTQPALPGRLEPIPVPAEHRLHLIIYIDNFNLRPSNRNRVLHRMHRFLREDLDREDQVMVVSYDRSLHVRVPFTTDRLAIANALEGLEEVSGIAVLRDSERRKVYEEVEASDNSFEALQHARFFADSVYTETRFTLQALSDHVSALSGLVGRKAILHVSDGLPLHPAEDVFLHVDERFNDKSGQLEVYNYDLTPDFRELVARANAGGVTFYTLDAGGLEAHDSISAEFGGTVQGGGRAFIDSVRSANLQAPLHILADDTGGRAITNTNAVEAGLSQVATDFDNYYSLGYQPGHQGDGRYYKVDVKVRRKGLVVRHRTGYRDKTTEARLTDGSIASLLFGFESNPLGAGLHFGTTVPAEEGSFHLPLAVRLPIGKLTLAPVEEAWVGRVQVSVVVMDDEGRISPVRQQEPLTVRIPAADVERARQQYFTYELTLAVRRGDVDVAVGIRDEIGTEISFLRRKVRVSQS